MSSKNSPGPTGPIKVLFVVPGSPFFPSGVVRVEQYLPFLDRAGIQYILLNYFNPTQQKYAHSRDPGRMLHRVAARILQSALDAIAVVHIWLKRAQIIYLAGKVDAVYIQWILPPIWMTRLLKRRNRRLIFDFDDAVFLVHPDRTKEMVISAWRVIAGSHFNLEYARKLNPDSLLLPSSVPIEKYSANGKLAHLHERPLRIGWIGGVGTLKYLNILVEPLRALAQAGLSFDFLIAGTEERHDLMPVFPKVNIVEISHYSSQEIPAIVSEIDIGVMPLDDGPWERGKCAMKALVYMAGGKPVVCSPVGEALHVVQDGVSGFVADSAEEWTVKLKLLAQDRDLRVRMGVYGREIVERRFSTRVCFDALYKQVLSLIQAP